jgi:hypothetical protein
MTAHHNQSTSMTAHHTPMRPERQEIPMTGMTNISPMSAQQTCVLIRGYMMPYEELARLTKGSAFDMECEDVSVTTIPYKSAVSDYMTLLNAPLERTITATSIASSHIDLHEPWDFAQTHMD